MADGAIPPTELLPTSFEALVVERGDDSIDVGVRTLTEADLLPGDVTIDVEWAAINFKDALVVEPNNRVGRISPLIPGVDLVGTVRQTTDDRYSVGQSVIVHGHELGTAHHGAFAQRARVPGHWVIPLPPLLSAREAATIGTAGFTAALSIHRLEDHGLAPEDGPVLVTGATGGVGSMAVSWLADRHYDVVASTGKEDEHPYLRGLGASKIIGRHELHVDDHRVLGPELWSGAIDCVGGATLTAILRTLRYGAAVAASGLTGGKHFESSVYPFIVRSVALLGIDSVATPRETRLAIWEELAETCNHQRLADMVADEIGLTQLPAALAAIRAGTIRGRVLVRP